MLHYVALPFTNKQLIEPYKSSALQPQADRPASLWLRISGVQPGALTLRDARLEVCPELAALLAGQQDALVQRLAESASLAAFFVELQNMVDQLSLARYCLPQSRSLKPVFLVLPCDALPCHALFWPWSAFL